MQIGLPGQSLKADRDPISTPSWQGKDIMSRDEYSCWVFFWQDQVRGGPACLQNVAMQVSCRALMQPKGQLIYGMGCM